MDQRPDSDDRSWSRALHRGYATIWVLLGLCPPAVAVLDQPPATKYWSFGLLAALGVSYGIVRGFPGNPVLRPSAYLGLVTLAPTWHWSTCGCRGSTGSRPPRRSSRVTPVPGC
ncbi:hypothetical protein WEI85_04925 [Actinomycetes bacterium KLBMP 9797]